MDDPWKHRQVFERYLYDYLIKKGMHETAEIFRAETDNHIDPNARPEIDVPDSFLHEWWSINYDHLSEWERKNTQDSNRVEGDMWQQGLISGGILVPKALSNPEILTSSSTPANLAGRLGPDTQDLDSIVREILTTKIPFNEVAGKRRKSEDSEDRSIDMHRENNSMLESSSAFGMDFINEDDGEDGEGASSYKANAFNLSSSLDEDKKDEEGAFPSECDTVKPSSSPIKEEKLEKGASPTKDDTIELSSSFIEEKKDEKGDSCSRDGDMHDHSSDVQGNDDAGGISPSNTDEHNESPKNDKSQARPDAESK